MTYSPTSPSSIARPRFISKMISATASSSRSRYSSRTVAKACAGFLHVVNSCQASRKYSTRSFCLRFNQKRLHVPGQEVQVQIVQPAGEHLVEFQLVHAKSFWIYAPTAMPPMATTPEVIPGSFVVCTAKGMAHAPQA